jgi:hypothetical protein
VIPGRFSLKPDPKRLFQNPGFGTASIFLERPHRSHHRKNKPKIFFLLFPIMTRKILQAKVFWKEILRSSGCENDFEEDL